MFRISLQRFAQHDNRKSAVVAQITPHCENFVRNLYSRIDNTRLNFRLAIPEVIQIEKF